MTYTAAFEELHEIVNEIEQGEISVDDFQPR
ncbi:MAG: exodeoxyribonuclease VII small subunit [Aequorivita sp.]